MYADPSDQNVCSVNDMNLRKKIKLKFIKILEIKFTSPLQADC